MVLEPSRPHPTRLRPTSPPALASFWTRVAALLIDLSVLAILNLLLVLVLNQLLSPALGKTLASFLGFFLFAAYFSGLEGSTQGATLGKWALGLRVVDLDGQRIGFTHALGRFLGKLLSMAILLIGFLMAAFTERRQALHDFLSGTIVILAPKVSQND